MTGTCIVPTVGAFFCNATTALDTTSTAWGPWAERSFRTYFDANAGIKEPDQLVGMVRGGHRQGITTSCIGFADGFDERLLAALADAGLGNDYWCDGPDQAHAVFQQEFGGLAAVVAQNLSVEVRPGTVVAARSSVRTPPIQ